MRTVENLANQFLKGHKEDYKLVASWSNGDGTFTHETIIPTKKEQDDFALETAKTTPFEFFTVRKNLHNFMEMEDRKYTLNWDKKKEQFKNILELSCTSMLPIENLIDCSRFDYSRIEMMTIANLSWFQRLKWKWKLYWAKCEHEFNTRGFMPLHGDDSGMRDQCTKCKKWIKR